MEFREEPLEGELRRRIATALRSVEGMESADEMNREVTGQFLAAMAGAKKSVSS